MFIRPMPLALALCAFVLLAAAATPAPQSRAPHERVLQRTHPEAAPVPPNGTYTYILSRNGTDRGKTTVVVFRPNYANAIETDEAGIAGAARAHIIAAYRDNDLGVATYIATYQAPFPRTTPLGRVDKSRPEVAFDEQTTVRYSIAGTDTHASIDGGVSGDVFPLSFGNKPPVHDHVVLDGPFMTGYLMLPAQRRRLQEAAIAPISVAFPIGPVIAPQRLMRATPLSPKTPKTDVALDVAGVARVWFDPATYVVHEVHVDALNIDARLVSYAKVGRPAPFEPVPAATATPRPLQTNVTFPSADGTTMAGTLAMPAPSAATATPKAATPAAPAVVFVPPAPYGSRDYGGDGPSPMYPDLAQAFAARGYATLRYDSRASGKLGDANATQTWEQSRADAQAAIRFAQSAAGIDPKRVYALGYGDGADIAIAAASGGETIPAAVVALAPTVLSYRACLQHALPKTSPNRLSRGATAYDKSSFAHDPAVLARRVTAPVLVLHPGDDRCGATQDAIDDYDTKLRGANPRATIVAAKDLTQRFGGQYDADSPGDSEALFPYRFDPSTAGAISDWLGSAKAAAPASSRRSEPQTSGPPKPPPAPPPLGGAHDAIPNVHTTPQPTPSEEVLPGQVTVPGPPLPGSPPPEGPSPAPPASAAPQPT